MELQRKNGARSCNHCCSGKATNITYFQFVFVAFGVQHAKRMRHTVICDLSAAVQYFSTFRHKCYDFRKTLLDIKCVFIFSTNFA